MDIIDRLEEAKYTLDTLAMRGIIQEAQETIKRLSKLHTQPRPILRLGNEQLAVGEVQRLLSIPWLRIDSRYGNVTRAAVIAFQYAHCLSPDGIVGRETWAALVAWSSSHGR